MEQEIRDSFDKVFEKIDLLKDTVNGFHLGLSERITKAETCLNGHCKNEAIHIGSANKEDSENGENVRVKFKFPRKWLLILFYIVIAIISGVGTNNIAKYLITNILNNQ